MKRRLALVVVLAVFGLVVGLAPLAHADEQPQAIPAGSYTVALPGGGTLGFTVDAAGNVTITMVPDGTTAGTPSLTEEGFSVAITNGTATNVVAVEVENEDGQLQVKAEQEVEDANGGDHSGDATQVSGGDNGSTSGSDEVSSPEPSPEPTVSESSTPDSSSGDGSGDVSPSPSASTGGGGSDG